jgi:hypothetical protein
MYFIKDSLASMINAQKSGLCQRSAISCQLYFLFSIWKYVRFESVLVDFVYKRGSLKFLYSVKNHVSQSCHLERDLMQYAVPLGVELQYAYRANNSITRHLQLKAFELP